MRDRESALVRRARQATVTQGFRAGMRLATLKKKLALAHILRNFDIVRDPDVNPDNRYFSEIQPASGFRPAAGGNADSDACLGVCQDCQASTVELHSPHQETSHTEHPLFASLTFAMCLLPVIFFDLIPRRTL